MSKLQQLLRPFFNRRVLWDVFMVWAALINLYLIAFDLTYLWLRPLYFRHLPVVTRVYDPVKGIVPHPLTQEVLDQVDAIAALLETDPTSPQLDDHLGELRRLFRRVLLENPFERSGQTRFFETFRQELARSAGLPPAAAQDPAAVAAAVDRDLEGTSSELSSKLDRFNATSRPAFELNYFREFDRGGRLTDYFWIIDLPFLTLFWIEFLVRWTMALRRHTFARWFFFPIFNWYDLLGLIPNRHFRIFRLLRAVSMYMRLRRSELSGVGKDAFSRAVAYVSNIITEEVSDRVALRILSELQEEISDGTHTRIVRATVEPRRAQIEHVVSGQIRQLLTDQTAVLRFRDLLRLNLLNAVDSSEALRSVPVPRAVLRPLVRLTGEVILDTTLETITTTIASDDGERALREVAGAVLDDLFYGPAVVEIEGLAKEISLQVIDHMKEVVAVKKWAEARPATPAGNLVPSARDASDDEAEAPAPDAPELGNGRPGASDTE